MFNGGEVGTILIIFMILVAVTERVSSWFRRLLA
jgi:ABC-type phosphate/phosphonate transport system permease subunit